MSEKMLRRPSVEMMTGLSRSSIYAMMQIGEFPRPIRIGKRAVAWSEASISDWLANRPKSNETPNYKASANPTGQTEVHSINSAFKCM